MSSKQLVLVVVLIFGLGGAAGVGVRYFAGGGHGAGSARSATSTPDGLPQVAVVRPEALRADGTVAATYFGEVLSDLDGQIFAFREGVVEKMLVDLGSRVRRGQVVALLSAGQFTPEYAAMLAEREEMVVKARAMVAAADANLARASKLGAAAQSDGANKTETVEVVTQQNMVANAQKETDSMVAVEQERTVVAAQKVDAEIRSVYAVLRKVFYSASVPSVGYSWQMTANAFGNRNPQAITQMNLIMPGVRKSVDALAVTTDAQRADVAKATLGALDYGLSVLDATQPVNDYTPVMLVDDREELNMARRELALMWNEYREQQVMVKKATVEGQAKVSDAQQMLRRMEADAEKMLITAHADLDAALRARGIVAAASGNRMVAAPFTGSITQRFVNIGQKIGMDTPLFALTQDSSGRDANIFVRFEVPESDVARFRKGDMVTVVRTNNPLYEMRASVDRVGVGVNTVTRAVQVEARLLNAPRDLLTHTTVRVASGQGMAEQLVVPRASVISREDGTLAAYIVKDGVVVEQKIEAGRVISDRVVISSGLAADAQLVLDPKATKVGARVTATKQQAAIVVPQSEMSEGHGAHGE